MLPAKQTLRLIHWLSERTKSELHDLVLARDLRVHDLQSLTSVAQALLDGASVTHTLQSLSRSSLESLKALAAGRTEGEYAELSSRGLVDVSGSSPELLIAEDIIRELPLPASPLPDVDTQTSTPEVSTRAGSVIESTLCCLEDLLELIESQSIPTNKDGALGPAGTKIIQEVFGATPDPTVLYSLALVSGICHHVSGKVYPGVESPPWRSMTRINQWHHVANHWWRNTPAMVREVLTANPTATWTRGLRALVTYHYPLARHDYLDAVVVEAELLGLHVEGVTTDFGLGLLDGAEPSLLSKYLPAHVPGVYATEDFTMLAPGPLEPRHRSVLGRLAAKELGGLVPRYRVTSSSLLRALHRGEKAEGIVDALQAVCQNPLPEGILHLVQDTIRQTEAIALSPAEPGTLVRVESEQRANELLADPALSMLSLTRVGPTELTTKWSPERAFSALQAAKYVSLVEVPSELPIIPRPSPDGPSDIDTAVSELFDSIEQGRKSGVSAALSSILEVATSHRIPLLLECDMGSAGVTEFVMEPKSLTNGRLRGIETKHQVERTIPVSSIVSALPWNPPESSL